MKIEKAEGMQIHSQLAKNRSALEKIQEKMATGKKLNRASDDAASMALAKELEKQVKGLSMAQRNSADGMSALRIADGATSQISDMLQRQRELALQASNGTLNQEQRAGLSVEFQALTEEVDRISQSTQFNGQNLLDGSSPLSNGQGVIQVGPGNQATDQVTLPATDLGASNIGIGSADIGTAEGASAAISALDSAMKSVNGSRSMLGASTNRLEASQSNAENQAINTSQSLSQVEDLDYAKALTDRVRAKLMGESSMSVLEHFNTISRSHLLSALHSI